MFFSSSSPFLPFEVAINSHHSELTKIHHFSHLSRKLGIIAVVLNKKIMYYIISLFNLTSYITGFLAWQKGLGCQILINLLLIYLFFYIPRKIHWEEMACSCMLSSLWGSEIVSAIVICQLDLTSTYHVQKLL